MEQDFHPDKFKEFIREVVSVATVKGGSNLDLMPESVILGGTFRAFSNATFYKLGQRIEEVCRGIRVSFYCMYTSGEGKLGVRYKPPRAHHSDRKRDCRA